MRRVKRDELARRIDATGLKPFAWAQANGFVSESLRRWLNGQRDPKIGAIRRLAEALHCDISDISEWTIHIDPAKMTAREEELDELRSYWMYLTQEQRDSLLNFVRTIAREKIEAENG